MAKRRRTAKQRVASSRNYAKARAVALKKRKGSRKPISRKTKRRVAVAAATGVALGTGAVVGRHQLSGSKFTMRSGPNVSDFTGKKLNNGVRVSRSGVTLGVNHPRDAFKSHRTVIGYQHKKLTADVLGQKLLGGPRSVMERRPPNARMRRRMDRFNVPMTEEAQTAAKMQSQHSTGKVFGHRVRPKPKRDAYLGGRGRSSYGNYSRGSGVTPKIPGTIGGRSARTESRGTTNPQAGRTISQDEVIRRTNAFMESLPKRRQTGRTRRRASRYYTSQPAYTGKGGDPLPRDRRRSRAQRAKRNG